MGIYMKLGLVWLSLLLSHPVIAIEDTDYPDHHEAMPLQPIAVAHAPVAYVNPPDYMQGEVWLGEVQNADPQWVLLHQSKVRSKLFKTMAAMIGISIGIGVVVLIGVHEGPNHIVNETVTLNKTIDDCIVLIGYLASWRC